MKLLPRSSARRSGVDEQEGPKVLAGVVPVEEDLPTMAKGCCELVLFTTSHLGYSRTLVAESSDDQEPPLPTRENPLHTSLRGSEDCDGVA